MKKFLLASAALLVVAAAAPALAADIPAPVYKAPVSAPPVYYTWTGCYIGAEVGYGWGRDRDTEITTVTGTVSPFNPADAARLNGAKAGGYLGCNYQTGAFVFGIEGDGEWANLRGSTIFSNTGVPPDFYETRIRTEESIRGRVGYAWDRWLLYVTGGVAFANINEHDVIGFSGVFTDNSTTRTGGTVGGGLEYAFTNNLIGRIEYRYANFGTFTYNPTVFPAFTENHKTSESVVRAGLAWKFDWGGPVVTRY